MNSWDDPFIQSEGVRPGYWCSRQKGTGHEVRVYPNGGVAIHGKVPAEVVIAVLFAAHPQFVVTSRREERAKYLNEAAGMIERAWDEVAAMFTTHREPLVASQIRSRWKGSTATVNARKLKELANRIKGDPTGG